MATLKGVDHTAVAGSDEEPPTQEDTVGEQLHETPERRLTDVLLDISVEDLSKEMEPYEYHRYPGMEEAGRGWARVAPLGCILWTEKKCRKPKHKEADNPTPLLVDPTLIAEHLCESHAAPHNNFNKSMGLKQQVGSWSATATAALQIDDSEWPVFNAMQKTIPLISLQEALQEEGTLRATSSQSHHRSSKYTKPENRPIKSQKQSHRPNSTLVPIKNFTFFPPIKSPHLNLKVGSQLCSGKKASEGETLEENCVMFDKKSEARRTRVDPVASAELPHYPTAQNSKQRTCQHNPHLFSAVSISISKRYRVPRSSKPDAAHNRSYSMREADPLA